MLTERSFGFFLNFFIFLDLDTFNTSIILDFTCFIVINSGEWLFEGSSKLSDLFDGCLERVARFIDRLHSMEHELLF